MSEPQTQIQKKNTKLATLLIIAGVLMLGLGFASKPLYDTFCRVTGYGGTPKVNQGAVVENDAQINREVTVFFDSNIDKSLAWSFDPEQVKTTVKIGESSLAFYKVKNLANYPVTGTATFNVTPIKAAPFFVKTECFCFTEQTLVPGEEVSFPVIFHIDEQIMEDKRYDDIKDITLSYTFFETEPSDVVKTVSKDGLGQDDAKKALN